MDRVRGKLEGTQSTRLDQILAADEELIPSSGFLNAVMERVQEETSAPPPIPFPWKRALPGLVLVAGVFGWMGVELVRVGVPAMTQNTPMALQIPPELVQPMEQAGWVAGALAVSLVSWLLARRLAGRAGMI